jgi:hypothetical protein
MILFNDLTDLQEIPKDIHTWNVRQGDSKNLNRVAGFCHKVRKMGDKEALQAFFYRLQKYFLANGVTEEVKLSTMLNAFPDKALRGVAVRNWTAT